MAEQSHNNCEEDISTTLTLEGVTFKTSGNIVFDDCEDNSFYMANSPMLEKLDCYLEHGMEMLMKKIKP